MAQILPNLEFGLLFQIWLIRVLDVMRKIQPEFAEKVRTVGRGAFPNVWSKNTVLHSNSSLPMEKK
jgi:hypothetical protein